LNRRAGCEPVDYIHPLLEPVLKRTLGVPLFQEQILKVAMVIADFRGDEAEELRRALGFHRSDERMRKVILKLRAAMERKGIGPEAIEKVIKGVASFALYGFPESHAISFANLVWTSAWLKVHRTAEFFTGLLNNQPMGFYSPATLLRDGKRHGLRFKPVSVLHSQWKCTIEEEGCIRLGFCLVRGLSTGRGKRIAAQRAEQPFVSLHDFRTRTQLAKDELRVLAKIGALNGLAEHRRDALWQVEEAVDPGDLFSWVNRNTKEPASMDQPLAPMSPGERTEADYHGTGLTVGPHPMQLVRADFPHLWRAADLPEARNGDWVAIAGNVICRQRPGTAKGFVFVSVEDETGIANAVIAPALFEKLRLLITQENFLVITGRLQNADKVIHIRASSVERLGETLLHGSGSHDFH
jgi:error-prone DNA polymerase